MTAIQTASGRMFPLTAPAPADVDIDDIAVALARQPRFNGMTRPDWPAYSVAQHALRVSLIVPPRHKLWGLLHDAAEAYIGDIASPLKRLLAPAIDEIEAGILAAVARRFGLDDPDAGIPARVKAADRQMLAVEAAELMGPAAADWAGAAPSLATRWGGLDLARPLPERAARALFRARFVELAADLDTSRRPKQASDIPPENAWRNGPWPAPEER